MQGCTDIEKDFMTNPSKTFPDHVNSFFLIAVTKEAVVAFAITLIIQLL